MIAATSPSLVEVIVCGGCFLATALIIFLVPFSPHERPIPIQYLEGSGDYVMNLVNNELFDGETISTWSLIVWGLAVPWILQMYVYLV